MLRPEGKKKASVTLVNKMNYSVERSNYNLRLNNKLKFIKKKSYYLIISKRIYHQKLIFAIH